MINTKKKIMYYTTYRLWFECTNDISWKGSVPIYAQFIYNKRLPDTFRFPILLWRLAKNFAHKIAINHKRLCFIKICICVYHVFVRYSCWRKMKCKTFFALNIAIFIVQSVYDILCRHIMNRTFTVQRSRRIQLKVWVWVSAWVYVWVWVCVSV